MDNLAELRIEFARLMGWRVELTHNRTEEPAHTQHELHAPNGEKHHFSNVSESDVWNFAFEEDHIIPDWTVDKSAAMDVLENIADDNDWRIVIVPQKYVALEAFAYTYGKWQEVAAEYFTDGATMPVVIVNLVTKVERAKDDSA